MKRYFNIKTNQGVETVDEVNREDFKTRKEFIAELSRLKGEYNIAGMLVYTSQRCTNEWKQS
jgi:hypothetical protein